MFTSIFAKIAMHFVDRWIQKNISDPAQLAAWNSMMVKLQKQSWISGSTPSDYESVKDSLKNGGK